MKTITFCLALIFATLWVPHLASAQSASTTANTLSQTNVPRLIQKVKEAKALLQATSLSLSTKPVYKKTKVKVGKKTQTKTILSNYALDKKNIALAILDPSTDEILITIGTQSKTNQTFPSTDRTEVKLVRFNGVNSLYQVNKPQGGVVVGLKYFITPTESGSVEQIKNDAYGALYTPYSSALNTPEVAKYGNDYIQNLINKVATDFNTLPSTYDNTKTITQAIDPALIRALLYAEHMDTNSFLATKDTQSLIDKINVLFAVNEGDTYRYSVSSANARGLAQFIPSTYKGLVAGHPDANLVEDFVLGMNDHENSVKSMYLLLDEYIKGVYLRATDSFIPAHAFDYGAAAYNGGVYRISQAAKQFGATWYQDQAEFRKTLSSRVTTLKSGINSLNKQIKKANNTAKSKLNKELNALKTQLSDANDQLNSFDNATLRDETIHYIEKMHRLIQVFNDQPTLLSQN